MWESRKGAHPRRAPIPASGKGLFVKNRREVGGGASLGRADEATEGLTLDPRQQGAIKGIRQGVTALAVPQGPAL